MFRIDQNLGERKGNNLFHSFDRFGVPDGTTAEFSGSAGLRNILARVTGAEISRIDGQIRSTVPGANLFLMNPNGIVFGRGASLDVKGSFTATTAHRIDFGDSVFTAKLPDQGIHLSAANPKAFGFGNPPEGGKIGGDIVVNGSHLEVRPAPPEREGTSPPGTSPPNDLQLIGRTVTVTEGARVVAPGGRIWVVAAGNEGGVVGDRDPGTGHPTTRGGAINITGDSVLTAAPSDSQLHGRIMIRGGQLVVSGPSTQVGDEFEAGGNGSVTSIEVAGKAEISGGATLHAGGPQGRISVRAESLLMDDGHLSVANGTAVDVDHSAVTVDVTADTVEIRNQASIANITSSAGKSGGIFLHADKKLLISDATLSSLASGQGDAGSIVLTGSEIRLENEAAINSSTLPGSAGNAGDISIDCKNGQFGANRSVITSSSGGSGQGGTISITASAVQITRDDDQAAIASSSFSSGRPGTIEITGRNLIRITGGTIENRSQQTSAGDIRFAGDGLTYLGNAGLIVKSEATILNGEGGDLSFAGGPGSLLVLNAGAELNASAITGNGGSITIETDRFLKSDSALLNTTSEKGLAGSTKTDSIEFQSPPKLLKVNWTYQTGMKWQGPSGWEPRDPEGYARVGSGRSGDDSRRRMILGP